MNIVITKGKIVLNVEFDFIYNINKKEKHISIARCKLELENGSIVDVYGYDEIADYLYKCCAKNICIEGEIDTNMKIRIRIIY